MIPIVESPPFPVMLVFQQIRAVQRRGRRNALFLQLAGDFPYIPPVRPFPDNLIQFPLIFPPRRRRSVFRGGCQFRPADHRRQPPPLLLVGNGNRNPAVIPGPGIGVMRRIVEGMIANPLRLLSRHLISQNFPANQGHRRLLLGNIDEHPLAGAPPVAQSGQQRPGGVGAGDGIAVIDARLHRPIVGVAGNVRHSAKLFLPNAIGHIVLPRPAVAESRHGCINQVGTDLPQGGVVIAQAGQAALPKILHQGIGDGYQLLKNLPPPRLRQLQSNAVLALMQAVEPAVAIPRLRPGIGIRIGGDARGRIDRPPVGIVHPQGFQFDDFRPHIGQQLGAVRAGPDAGKV